MSVPVEVAAVDPAAGGPGAAGVSSIVSVRPWMAGPAVVWALVSRGPGVVAAARYRWVGRLGAGRAVGWARDVFVGPSLRHFYARFVEFGTASHEVFTRRSSRIRGMVGGTRSVTGDVFSEADAAEAVFRTAGGSLHPGTTALPFLRPALDTLAESIVQGIGEEIGRRLDAVRP